MIAQDKSGSCWHAAAKMIWAFKYKQSINPLPKVYEENKGLRYTYQVGHPQLAEELGMENIPDCPMSLTPQGLSTLLKKCGPLWTAGAWWGAAHVIVTTGIDDKGVIYVNDPNGGAKRFLNIRLFNEGMGGLYTGMIMFLPDHRANADGFSKYSRVLG